jgi:hypothetical protein
MASTYTTNSGIEKPGSGEQSGTWGATINTNMDIVDTLVSGFVSITAGSTSVTLTTTDGAITDGMNKAIKYVDGGDLGGNCTVTLSPNDQEKLIFVENGLSASRSLIFSQGSGANFTLQNGKQALIRSDGAGSGAAVYGVLANLEIDTLEVTGAAAIDGALTAGGGVAVTGNVTATGTVEPAGDTAASDSAAIGYTSAEGLILTGQGSTNDVTIKNDADADVITIATGATNVDVVGDLTAATLNADGDTSASDNAAIGYTSAEGIIITGQGSTNDITLKNDADAEVCGVPTGTDDLRFPDDAKAEWGTGGDLQIYHDASNSYIVDNGTGNLKIAGSQIDLLGGADAAETMATFADDGAVTLYYDNSTKIATTSTGIQVTGTALATTDTDTSNTGSVTLDFQTNQNFILTFTGNVTLANPTTEQVGQSGIIVCIQDGTGSRTLSLGTDYETAAGAGITLSTAASAVDVIPYFVKAAASIQLGAVQKAFS